MDFIILDNIEERKANCKAFKVERKALAGRPDTISFQTLDDHLAKYDRVLYQDKQSDWHEYIISSIDEEHGIDGIAYKIFAENSLTEIRGDFIEDSRAIDASAQMALDKALASSRWTGVADNLGSGTATFYRCSAWTALSDVLAVWHAEIKTEIKVANYRVVGRKVYLRREIADDQGKRFSWGKDIKSIKRTISDADVITALYGFGKGVETGSGGYGRKLDFASINQGKMYVEDLTALAKFGISTGKGGKKHRFGVVEFSEETDPQKLLEVTRQRLKELSVPHVTYEAAVVDLASHGLVHEGVKEGDLVTVQDHDLSITLKARVMEITESLDDESETKLVIGNFKSLLGKDVIWTPSDDVKRLLSKESMHDRARYINDEGSNITYVDKIIETFNGQLDEGQSYIFFDINRGLVVLDNKNESRAKWCIELNARGLRFSNSRYSNRQWRFTTLLTGDGLGTRVIGAAQIIAGAIMGDHINAGAITSSKIAAGAITAGKIAAGAITANDITAGTLHSKDWSNWINLDKGTAKFTGEIKASNLSTWNSHGTSINSGGYQMTNGQVANTFAFQSGTISEGVTIGSNAHISGTGIYVDGPGYVVSLETEGTAWLALHRGNGDDRKKGVNCVFYIGYNGVPVTPSDMKLKKNIKKINGDLALDFIRETSLWEFDRRADDVHSIGILANAVKRSTNPLAELVVDTYDPPNGEKVLSANYGLMAIIAQAALKKVDDKVQKLEQENLELKARLDRLERSLSGGN